MKQKKYKKNTKPYYYAMLAAVVIAGGLWYWHDHRSKTVPGSANGQTSGQKSGSIDYGPPTAAEKQEAVDRKKDILNGSQSNNSGKKIEVQIVSASNTAVRANIIGVFEDGGKCTATYNNGSQTVTVDAIGVSASNYSQCTVKPPVGKITGSGWSVVLSYTSSAATGQSASTPLTN